MIAICRDHGGRSRTCSTKCLRLVLGSRKQCYLAPYISGNHWQLMIFCPVQQVVVFLCSLHYDPPKANIRAAIDISMQAYSMMESKSKVKSIKKKPTWICPKEEHETRASYFYQLKSLRVQSQGVGLVEHDRVSYLTGRRFEPR